MGPTHRPRVALAALSLALLATATACPQPSDQACGTAPAAMVDALKGHFVNGGNIRFPLVLRPATSSRVFLSFENRTDADVAKNATGHILTLVAPRDGSTDFAAVDAWARDETNFPHATVDVRADGAVASRGCVDARRKKS